MSKSKQKGTAWETECVKYLTSYIKKKFNRLPLVGTKDVGDIRSEAFPEFVFDAKIGKMHCHRCLKSCVKRSKKELMLTPSLVWP